MSHIEVPGWECAYCHTTNDKAHAPSCPIPKSQLRQLYGQGGAEYQFTRTSTEKSDG